jgi:hypothetical protein
MSRMKLTNNLGILLLAIWLILIGLSAVVTLGDVRKPLDILAMAAGASLLLKR